ncbi:PAS domain-containing sensor histidine kinase [Aquincola sp. J276]|uniref:PAS domain-containing sensor histidine kinase n=1 Tax=Aquincola sp. J276 TaxID=2898432 RepID=UPI002150C5D6|nr:PAS domain-containing sensor histidine kinase [Aquincola sp. J276]MCR5868164.1 PAS domain-containing sensor histidine kinase [Aquincola sp. J276]
MDMSPHRPVPDEVQQLLLRWPEREEIYAFLALDPVGTVLWVSPAAELLLGYVHDDLVGESFGRLFTSEDRAKGLDQHELTIARHVGFCEDDRWHVRRDGTSIWTNGVTTAVKDHRGDLLGFAKVKRDRTDLKAQLVTLQNRVASLQQTAQDRLAFDETMVHEQANVLNALTAAVELLARSEQASRPVVEMLTRQVGILGRLLEDFRTGMHPGEVPTPKLIYETVQLNETLTDVANGVGAAAAAGGITLETLLPSGQIVLRADRSRLQQIVHNLLINAIKCTPAGGKVWLKATVEGEHVVVRVEDNGVGISGDMLPRIFELFTQEPRSLHLARGGSGIGLAVVKQWVDAHGGTVEVRSEGEG